MNDIHEMVGSSAVAIYMGMASAVPNSCPIDMWKNVGEEGYVEFYNYVGEHAALSASVCTDITELFFVGTSFPGVYPYEVDEAYGAWLVQKFLAGGTPDSENDEARKFLGQLVWQFFAQEFSGGRTSYYEHACSLADRINVLTGYLAPREMAAVEELIETKPTTLEWSYRLEMHNNVLQLVVHNVETNAVAKHGYFPNTPEGLSSALNMVFHLNGGDPTKNVILPGDFD